MALHSGPAPLPLGRFFSSSVEEIYKFVNIYVMQNALSLGSALSLDSSTEKGTQDKTASWFEANNVSETMHQGYNPPNPNEYPGWAT